MRREAAFRCSVVGELHRQLEWASTAARLRLLDAAESLIREIDLDRGYPVEFVTYRLTAWKPEPGTVVETVAGEALLADLVTMIQRVSRRCALPLGKDAVLLDGTAKALGVSRRTLVRLRRRGLAMRYAQCSDGHLRLVCSKESLAWFRTRWPDLIGGAGGPAAPHSATADILRAARTMQGSATLQAMARTLAATYSDRSPSAIRSVLRRAAARGDIVLPMQSRLSHRDQRLAQRATRRGVPPAQIAAHLRIGVPSLHRALLRLRRQRLAEIHGSLPPPEVDSGVRDEETLAVPSVLSGLGSWDAIFLLDSDSADLDSPEAALRAMHVLRRRFGLVAGDAPAQPSAGQLDRAETDLRWMTQLRWQLVAHLAPVLRQTVAQWCGRSPVELPSEMQRLVLRRGLETLRVVIVHQPAAEADRLGARARAAIDLCLAGIDPPRRDLALSRLSEMPSVPMWWAEPWRDLLPDPAWEARLGRVPARHRALSILRWGFGGQRPWTLQEVADLRGCKTSALARAWAAAQRSLLRSKETP
jgi:hypothetical protein